MVKMASLEPFVLKIKPAMDAFLRAPSKDNLSRLQKELNAFNWVQMKIFHAQILLPLVLKLEEFGGFNQELITGTIDCVRLVTSKLYLNDVKGLRSMLIIVLRQIRDCERAVSKPNLSEELKLAAVDCIAEVLRRSTSDVLEEFYTKASATLLGQILLTLVEFIESEKYKKLIIKSMECLMVIFYVYDGVDYMDVVLRSQVADTLFIFLPKIITVLFKTSMADDKFGETLKSTAIKSLGRILCVIYEDTNEETLKRDYNINEFKTLINDALNSAVEQELSDADILGSKKHKDEMEARFKRLQVDGRTKHWFAATSRKLWVIFEQTSVLRSHESKQVRTEYALMCCSLLQHCVQNLRHNFVVLLENVVALSADNELEVNHACRKVLQQLQSRPCDECIFDESAERLFDEHLNKLPRVIYRCDDREQYTELLFLKAFLNNLSATKLQVILSIPKNLEMFCMCLLSAVELKCTRELLTEEYALRQVNTANFEECSKLHWRQFKHLNSMRCIQIVHEICAILGKTKQINRIIFDHLIELLRQQNEAMNDIILMMVWMCTSTVTAATMPVEMRERLPLVELLLAEILHDKHWHLALQADQVWRLKVEQATNWFVDYTPGLYESAIEIRTQDFDSDDEHAADGNDNGKERVTIADAEFNVLHSCIILDALAHCAKFMCETFDKYIFRSLHKVLLKLANSNKIIYEAANFAFISMQKALRFAKAAHFIESYTDYITYHLNTILKRCPDSRSAVDILSVVLQFSTPNTLPHLTSIFQTIQIECTKANQAANIDSYLKVFHAFLTHINQWQLKCEQEVNNTNMNMQVDAVKDEAILSGWLNVLTTPLVMDEEAQCCEDTDETQQTATAPAGTDNTEYTTNTTLPHYIEMTKDILNEVLKFISSSEKMHQILALECLISGLPLLKDYENELLPLVHILWPSFVEKFHQKDAIVLNRCFTLLNILATHAKEFILKRSLNDIMPYLENFLREAAAISATDHSKAQTQIYKLQAKLLQEFSNLIQSIQIDGKHLNNIAEVIAIYLSEEQPKELQNYAVQFFSDLRFFDGPFVYVIILKKSHLKKYSNNVSIILKEYGIKC